MDRDDILRKIKACLAMARSGEANEAATALRQAQALMNQYGIDHPELLSSDVQEHSTPSGAGRTPAQYEALLASLIARAYGCDLLHGARYDMRTGRPFGSWTYIGVPPHVEVASYAMAVLMRQLAKARAEYMSTALRRYKRTNKTIKADAFCDGWVQSVARLIPAQKMAPEQTAAIATYMQRQHPSTGTLQPRQREAGRLNVGGDIAGGMRAGRDAQLHQGVGARAQPKMLEGWP